MVNPIPPADPGKNRRDSKSQNLGNSSGSLRNRRVKIKDSAESVKILKIFDDIIQTAEQEICKNNSNGINKMEQKNKSLVNRIKERDNSGFDNKISGVFINLIQETEQENSGQIDKSVSENPKEHSNPTKLLISSKKSKKRTFSKRKNLSQTAQSSLKNFKKLNSFQNGLIGVGAVHSLHYRREGLLGDSSSS